MTDKLQPLSTQIATPSQTVFPTNNTVSNQDVPQKVETVEEEPYTIKCICNFSDDDGNTIYCETCDTWQHIECFYPNNVEDAYREDFSHSCAECKPRPLDRQRAIERQKARLSTAVFEEETSDKKPKRPPSKSHKKKPKPNDLQLNGHAPSVEASKHGSPNDHSHPPKKTKSSHKSNQSISSQAAKRSPSYSASRANPHGHPPSPANTPPDLPNDFEIHNYSEGFLSLYNEQDVQIVQTNSFASLVISNAMSLWLREPERMRQETGQEYNDVFQILPSNIESLKRPLHVEHHDKKSPPNSDKILRWQYLTTPAAIEKDVPLMELNGQIGFQKDYCADPDNRWDELTSPLPFVFFHPMLPLYIDTRREGSRARYVRRSCKPNAVLDTFLSEGSEYHFWLVSDRAIAANEQITLPWDFRFPKKDKARMLRLLGLGDDEPTAQDEADVDQSEYHSIASWVFLILSEYGGCACDLDQDCAFARFHRNYLGKAHARSNTIRKKSRKPKTHTISPTSTGHATNSRAASEGHLDETHDHDGRSVSGSSRSKPPSRDMTPARQGSFDTLGILTEPTDRDKRKVAMVEDSFRRMEQAQPPRKKKRVSDGTGPLGTEISSTSKPKNRNSTSNASSGPNGTLERNYVDAATSRSKSGSPASAVFPPSGHQFRHAASRQSSRPAVSRQTSLAPHSSYCDVGVQTDPVEGEWYSEIGHAPKTRRRVVSLSKRLLENRHRFRLDDDERQKQRHSLKLEHSTSAMDVDSSIVDMKVPSGSPSLLHRSLLASPGLSTSGDIPMPDASSTSPPSVTAVAADLTNIGHTATSSPTLNKSPDLRVQMPPIPTFGNSNVLPTVSTPLSATGSIVQSPFSSSNLPSPFGPPSVNGFAANPSPIKKKLSLSDYTKNRMNKTGTKPSLGTNNLRPSTSNIDEPKSATSADESIAVDSPTTEKPTDGLPTPGTNAMAPEFSVNGSL